MARRRLTDTDCTETLRVSSSSEVAGWTCKECFYFLTLSPGLGRETQDVEGEGEEENMFTDVGRIMQVLRIARLMRIFKLARRSVGLQSMAHTVKTSWKVRDL